MYPWDRMNFDLPNSLLGEIWSIQQNMVSVRRSVKVTPKAKFGYRLGVYDPAYEPLVEAEREKARKYAEESEVK